MKARINREPYISGYVELNKKFDCGFQGRMIVGVTTKIIDDEPFTLANVYAGVYGAIEDIKKREKYKYNSHELIHIDRTAIKANKNRDFVCAQIAADIQGDKTNLYIPESEDYITTVINDNEETVYTTRGALLSALIAWREDRKPAAKDILRQYCEYLTIRNYGKIAKDIFFGLESMDIDAAVEWIKTTYGKYVPDTVELVKYIMPRL